MKVLIVSDTHGDTVMLNKVKSIHKDVDIIMHAGDSELPKFLTDDMLMVRGNCDYFEYPLTKDIEIQGYKIHMEHGHKVRIPDSLFVENNDYDIVIFGHTHCAKAKKIVNGKYFFNPGSLVRPRDSDKGSYIILNLEKDNFSFEIHRISIE